MGICWGVLRFILWAFVFYWFIFGYVIGLFSNIWSEYVINSTIYSLIHTINWTFFPYLLWVDKRHKIEISYLWCDSNRTSPFLILSLNWTLGPFLFSIAATWIFLLSNFVSLFSYLIVFSILIHSFYLLCYRLHPWIIIVLIILLSAVLASYPQPSSLIILPFTPHHFFASFLSHRSNWLFY